MILTIGFETTHALSGDKMRVVKNDNHPWYTCERIEEKKEWHHLSESYRCPRAICHIENLQSQLTLF